MGGDSASWEEFRKQKKAEKKKNGDTCAVAAIVAVGLAIAGAIVSSGGAGVI